VLDHANSAREAIVKLCALPLLAGENVSTGFVLPTVASCVDLVVHLVKTVRDTGGCARSSPSPGASRGDVVEVAGLFVTRGQRLVRADGFPPHPERFDWTGIPTCRPCWRTSGSSDVGALLGLLFGLGCRLAQA
jgi:pilus assembly protein CpaF